MATFYLHPGKVLRASIGSLRARPFASAPYSFGGTRRASRLAYLSGVPPLLTFRRHGKTWRSGRQKVGCGGKLKPPPLPTIYTYAVWRKPSVKLPFASFARLLALPCLGNHRHIFAALVRLSAGPRPGFGDTR